MLPPSDSLQHQDLKLAEALSDIQAIEVPPPSYTAMPAANETFHAYEVEDYDDDGIPTPSPIIIKITASVQIQGQGNTIVLPPSNAPTRLPPNLAARTAQAGLGRAEKLTRTVLTALRDAGLLEDAEKRQRPLELHVDASVNVNGEKNVICAGIPRITPDNGQPPQAQLSPEPTSSPSGSRKRRAESVCCHCQ